MLTRMMVLGLLKRRPMHGYEIQQVLQMGYVDRWAGILPGSIYHALKKMEQEGFVQVDSVEQTGHRSRAVHRITDPGETELHNILRFAWETPATTYPSMLYAAMSFLEDLPRPEMLAAVNRQIAELKQRQRELELGEHARSAHAPVPEYVHAVFANSRAHLEADLKLLTYLQGALPTTPPFPFGAIPEISPERADDPADFAADEPT